MKPTITNAATGEAVKVKPRRPNLAKSKGRSGPRILLFDIETTPLLSWHWRCYKENINPVQVVKHSRVLCWAAKWLDNTTVYYDSTRKDGEDDRRVCESLWSLCDEADIIVGHNGQAFDLSTMNARWCLHGFAPPAPSKCVDTLKIARHRFRFPSNKLEGIAKYLGMPGKTPHEGFGLWLKCMSGDRKAWAVMEEYNVNDVLLLEAVYLVIRPWDTRHPNVALCYDDDEVRCVVCGGRNLTRMPESAKTAVSEFEAMRCDKCGKPMRVGKRYRPSKAILRNVV